jgi:hypothetical protein
MDGQPFTIKTNNTSALHIDTAGKIGIGTSNPTGKVEIAEQDALHLVGFQPVLTLLDTEKKRFCASGEFKVSTEPSDSFQDHRI